MTKRILVIEDDPWQADAIKEALEDRGRSDAVPLEVELADSESAALAALREPTPRYDAYIVDLMLPWSQDGIAPAAPSDAAGLKGMTAGLRLLQKIDSIRNQSPNRPGDIAPLWLYTIVENPAVRRIQNAERSIFSATKTLGNQYLAKDVLNKLSR